MKAGGVMLLHAELQGVNGLSGTRAPQRFDPCRLRRCMEIAHSVVPGEVSPYGFFATIHRWTIFGCGLVRDWIKASVMDCSRACACIASRPNVSRNLERDVPASMASSVLDQFFQFLWPSAKEYA